MAFEHSNTRMMRLPNRRRMAAALRALVALALLAAAVGCSSAPRRPPPGTLEPDKFLWERGTEALNEERWFTAREYFEQLVETYPQSTYRADARLGIADSYLGEGTLEAQLLAINEFREFLSYFPLHERADYAQFKLGMAHYYQMRNPQRDQTETKEAIAELTTFIERYPNSALLEEGKKRLREAKDRLGEHEYNVGYFYYRSVKWYPGAIDRFMTLLKNDPEYTYRDAVYYYLAQSLIEIGRPAEALPFLDKLIEEFQQSEYLEDARKQTAELKALIAKKSA